MVIKVVNVFKNLTVTIFFGRELQWVLNGNLTIPGNLDKILENISSKDLNCNYIY